MQDFYNNPELGLKSYLESKTDALRDEIIKIYKKGQDDGWIRKDLNIEFLIYFLLKKTPCMTDTELLKLFKSPQNLVMECTNLFICGISPAK